MTRALADRTRLAALVLGATIAVALAPRAGAEPDFPSMAYVERLREMQEEAQPDGPDGWPVYEQAMDELRARGIGMGRADQEWTAKWGIRHAPFLRRLLEGRWGDPLHRVALRVLERYQPIIDLLIEASQRPAFRPPLPMRPLFDRPVGIDLYRLPYTFWINDLELLLHAELRRAAHAGEWARLLDVADALVAIPLQMTRDGTGYSNALATGTVGGNLSRIQQVVLEVEIPAGVCRRLMTLTAPSRWPLRRLLAEELAFWRLHLDGLPVKDRRNARAANARLLAVVRPWWWDWRRTHDPLPDEAKRIIERWPHLDERESRNLERSRAALEHPRAHFQATQILLRLEMHHARTGRWPDRLTDAMPREETLDPVYGAPFRYTPSRDIHPYVLAEPHPAAAAAVEYPFVLRWPERWDRFPLVVSPPEPVRDRFVGGAW